MFFSISSVNNYDKLCLVTLIELKLVPLIDLIEIICTKCNMN